MSDVMLPWPEPRRPKKDQPPAPHYEIQQVNSDGSTGPVEVLPIVRPPWAAATGRRGFLGAGIASSVAAALLLSACDNEKYKYRSPSTTPTEEPSYPTYPPYTTESETPTYSPPPSTEEGGGGLICTCNKVCTCIPVCQAHRLLDPDPTVRRLAEIVVLAMGLSELKYLRWAAGQAPTSLRARIEDLVGRLHCGHRLGTDDLADGDYETYLASGDPVTALMAAQALCLRALSLGTGLTGPLAQRAAEALTTGRALHLERAPSWRH